MVLAGRIGSGDYIVTRYKSSQAPELESADYHRLAAFRHLLRRFLVFSETAARGAGVTPQQHQALLALKGAPDPEAATVGFLAEQLLLAPNSAAELADRMEKCGLIARAESATDRRRVLLSLTTQGDQVLGALSAAHLKELRQWAPALEDLLRRLLAEGA
jgi:DNA-binding MarR family transcriptional regulator